MTPRVLGEHELEQAQRNGVSVNKDVEHGVEVDLVVKELVQRLHQQLFGDLVHLGCKLSSIQCE